MSQRLAEAIGQFESGGNYKAVGKRTASGDVAYGKYQVMGNNVPTWTKEATGTAMTPEQFLSDPKAQDAVAHHKIGQLYTKYKNPADVASSWFTGKPLAKAGEVADVNGTTAPHYAQAVQSIYEKTPHPVLQNFNEKVDAARSKFNLTDEQIIEKLTKDPELNLKIKAARSKYYDPSFALHNDTDLVNYLSQKSTHQLPHETSRVAPAEQRAQAFVGGLSPVEEKPTLLDKAANQIDRYTKWYSETAPIKALGKLAGGFASFMGNVAGFAIGGVGEAAIQEYKFLKGGEFNTGAVLREAKQTAEETGKFGESLGVPAATSATLGIFGKAVNLVVGLGMGYEGIKNMKQGYQKGDWVQFSQGVTQAVPAFIGLKNATGEAFGDVKASYESGKASETPIRTFAKELGKRSKENLILSKGAKAQLGREYKFLRYDLRGKAAPTLSVGSKSLLMGALKPSILKRETFAKDLDVVAEVLKDKKVNNLVDLNNEISSAKKDVWGQVQSMVKKGDEAGLTIDGNKIAAEIRKIKDDPKLQTEFARKEAVPPKSTGVLNPDGTPRMLPPTEKVIETGILKQLEAKAKAYEGKKIGFLDAESILETTNAETAAYYAKNKIGRSLAERSDPMLRAELKLADQLRTQQDTLLDSIDQSGIRGLKRTYGALRNVGETTVRRLFASEKLNKSSLAQSIGAGRQAAEVVGGIMTGHPAIALSGIVDKLMTDYVKDLETPNSKIRRAFERINSGASDRGSILGKMKENTPALSIKDVSEETFKGLPDLSTKLLEQFRGMPEIISEQQFNEVLNKAKKQGIKQADEQAVMSSLVKEDGKINLVKTAAKVEEKLVPLTPTEVKNPRWSNIGEDFIGAGKYGEVVYQSPIKTSAGDIHFRGYPEDTAIGRQRGTQDFPNYFSHIRYEDIGKTRKILETQSDLMQKENFEKERGHWHALQNNENLIMMEKRIGKDGVQKVLFNRNQELSKLQPYNSNDPLAQLRTFREEVKRAARDGKDTLLIPTGETAMKIEGLGQSDTWYHNPSGKSALSGGGFELIKPEELKVGKVIDHNGEGTTDSQWIITEVLGDGKFKAVPSNVADSQKAWTTVKDTYTPPSDQKYLAHNSQTGEVMQFSTSKKADEFIENAIKQSNERHTEIFDISGKTDTSHFVYKLNESAIPKEARRMGLQVEGTVKQDSGEWWKIKIPKERARLPVEAFGAIGGATGAISPLLQKKLDKNKKIYQPHIENAYKRHPNLPRLVLEATIATESSTGTDASNQKTDYGKYGWLIGLTNARARDLMDRQHIKVDTDSVSGAIATLGRILDVEQERWQTDDPEILYNKAWNRGGSKKNSFKENLKRLQSA